MDFVAVDVVFALVLVFTTLRGAFRGFVTELLSMASLILGIVGAILFSGAVSSVFNSFLGESAWSQVAAFLAVFLAIYILVKIFENALHRLIEHIHLESLDHALGLFLGVVEGLLLTFVLILIIQVQPLFSPERVLEGSVFAQLLIPFLPQASELLNRRTMDV
ncbi:MAG: CvpA family protein [Spirochaetota bacterium]